MATYIEREFHGLGHGDHACLIYEAADQQLATAVAFLSQGLDRDERCVYLFDGRDAEELQAALEKGGVDVEQALARGAISFRAPGETYLRRAPFEPRHMLAYLDTEERHALAAGFSGLRIAGEMTWAQPGARSLIEYEALLNEMITGRHIVTLCQYHRPRFSSTCIQDVLRTHPLALLDDQLCTNTFYEPPEMVLATAQGGGGDEIEMARVGWRIERLRRSRVAERTVEERHRLLRAAVEGTTEAVFVKDREGRYLLVNEAGAALVGRTPAQMVGKDATQFFEPAEAAHMAMQYRNVLASGKPQTREATFDVQGSARSFLRTVAPWRDNDGNVLGIVGIAQEITEQKRLQAERDRLMARLRLQIDRLPLAYLMLDDENHVQEWNPAAERMFGYTKQEVLGRDCLDLIVPQPVDDKQRVLDRVRRGDLHANSVNQNLTKDGHLITCEWFNTPLAGPGGRHEGMISLAQDVTARKYDEAALRDYAEQLATVSRRLLAVQESERCNLARELHDEIGQKLTGLSFLLGAKEAGVGPPVGVRLQQARSIVESLLESVRALSFDLRPAALDELGLVPALLALFERYTQQTGVLVDLKHRDGDRRFSTDVETGAYRVVQEALTNAARHAGVAGATVRLWTTAASLNVQIEDRGSGFDVDAALARPASAGLTGMRERVMLLGGYLTIESQLGAGTQVTAVLPLDRDTRRSQ